MGLSIQKYIFLITYTALIFWTVLNFSHILGLLNKISLILLPFIYGFIIAYIINWPYKYIEKNLAKYLKSPKITKLISITISYLLLVSIFIFIFFAIIPQLYINVVQFLNNVSNYTDRFFIWSKTLERNFKLDLIPNDYLNNIIKSLPNLAEKAMQFFIPNIVNFTRNFAVGIYNWIIGLIISFYLIGSKDKLINQIKILASVYIPKKILMRILKITKLTHVTFGKFIVGKIIDSIIIGVLCFIGISILKIPYTLLISAIVAVTNIIPFFGPFIGAVPCIVVLLIINPLKAIWFAIFILILQQIDGNIIGPKILGNTVGISGLWIMFSVIIGGGLFGVTGMVIGVPIFAVIYTIISERVHLYYSSKNFRQ